jgi:hypothetical protein
MEDGSHWYADSIIMTDFRGSNYLESLKKRLVPEIKEIFDFKGDERDIVIISINKLPRSF